MRSLPAVERLRVDEATGNVSRNGALFVHTTGNASTFLDDRISILLDTFHDLRNGYLFQISAGGAREDALVADNGSRVDSDWDGIWSGRARFPWV